MVSYAARAVPWFRVLLAAGVVVLLMELVRWNPWVLWPLEGTAVGMLAGAAAWSFDESAAAVVDASPRSLAWRTAARLPALVVLAGSWVAVALHAGAGGGLLGHRDAITLQGLAAVAAAAGVACWRRSRGEPAPGLLVATAVVPATATWALVRPFDATLVVFPYAQNTPAEWDVSTWGWLALGCAGLVLVASAVCDAPWWMAARSRRL